MDLAAFVGAVRLGEKFLNFLKQFDFYTRSDITHHHGQESRTYPFCGFAPLPHVLDDVITL